MGIRLSKPWESLDPLTIAALPAQLGVYQIADDGGNVLSVGYAGAKHPFGLRSALEQEIEFHGTEATHFRYEFTSNYRSRWDELLMLHLHDHGQLPDHQRDEEGRVGRLSPN
ncbi:MAG: hypothetical protein VX785_09145 [Actinomycetota bacterium]|uniref:DUF7508 domain-containing protein n=1 Tax=marine metagenome TaxID=408172 RepID=A0A381QJ49_9ZZZZ|nr:sporulation protein [Acidimicrobiales bacterium]MEC8921816.1 hypothetical protein [Actinomycetota bacterium]MEC9315922.1 hypothetical protein [Actinomycetota bacterium]MED5552849.1 hypothetical protein [Actinomycetota bacterium]MEE3187925.1 hypothetical protein [Actinomycetota bacterium]|tara:strand:+ start:290 stop:625 length:336 start_codon:yes stop_codon:yes gene_type:complete